jgi:hypothetical protein
MAWGKYAQCPQCGVTAHGDEEIEEIFGFRYGGTKPQSWCRSCRSSSSSERLSVYDAANIWLSNGMDEDYTFGYSEDELRRALN